MLSGSQPLLRFRGCCYEPFFGCITDFIEGERESRGNHRNLHQQTLRKTDAKHWVQSTLSLQPLEVPWSHRLLFVVLEVCIHYRFCVSTCCL